MPFNGSGTFSRLYSWVVDAANSVDILSSRMDAEMNGFAAGLTNCITRDGQSPPSADLPMGGKKLTNLGAATAGTDALNRDTADARYPQAPGGFYGGNWSVQTPNSGTTGGLQLRGNATSGFAYEQITDATAMSQWGVWQYDSSGNASWSGTLKVGTNVVWHAGNLNAAALNTIYGFTPAPTASPTFTGVPAAPTAAGGTNTTQVATTAFVAASFAPLASPTLTGTPAAPTAAVGTSTTQLATTAYVMAAKAPAGQTIASSATVTPTFNDDFIEITAQAAGLTLANPTGTAANMWGIAVRIKDNGSPQTIAYGTQYRGVGVTLPTTTVAAKTLVLGMIFNNALTKWDVVSVAQE